MDLAHITHHHFSPLVGEHFVVTLEGGPVEASLTSVRVMGQGAGREAFSLLFDVPSAAALSQRVYAVEHETLGPIDLFLVPVGRTATGLALEAIFT